MRLYYYLLMSLLTTLSIAGMNPNKIAIANGTQETFESVETIIEALRSTEQEPLPAPWNTRAQEIVDRYKQLGWIKKDASRKILLMKDKKKHPTKVLSPIPAATTYALTANYFLILLMK
jgi:hypothetical protein